MTCYALDLWPRKVGSRLLNTLYSLEHSLGLKCDSDCAMQRLGNMLGFYTAIHMTLTSDPESLFQATRHSFTQVHSFGDDWQDECEKMNLVHCHCTTLAHKLSFGKSWSKSRNYLHLTRISYKDVIRPWTSALTRDLRSLHIFHLRKFIKWRLSQNGRSYKRDKVFAIKETQWYLMDRQTNLLIIIGDLIN